MRKLMLIYGFSARDAKGHCMRIYCALVGIAQYFIEDLRLRKI